MPPCNVTVPFSPRTFRSKMWTDGFFCAVSASFSCSQESNQTSEPEGDESAAPWCIFSTANRRREDVAPKLRHATSTVGDEPTCRIGGGGVGISSLSL